MKRLGHFSIICLFLAFIYVPLILSILIEDKEVSTAEKRKLAKLAKPDWTVASLVRFPDQLELYYNDHFGLREQLVVFYNFLYFNILQKSPLPSVTVGQDEWLFYNAEGVLLDYLGLQQHSEEEYETWKRMLQDRQEWLADQGIRYLFVVAPYKMMIYPEKLPARVQKKAGVPLVEKLGRYIGREGTIEGFVDLRGDMLEAKGRRQVYYRTDTHWNPDGAFDAYRAIMHRIRQWFPEVQVLPESVLKKARVSHRGDICITLNLNSISPEWTVKSEVEPSCSAKNYTRVEVDVQPTGPEANNPNYLPVENGCAGNSLKALVIHDSFGLFLRPYFNETFGKVIYSNYIDLQDLKELVSREHPDVIVDVRVARHLLGMLEPDPEVEQYILNKHFRQSSDVLLRVDGERGQESLGEVHDLDFRPGQDGLLLLAAGDDPSAEISFDAAANGEPLLVRLSLVSPADTVMQIFYTTPGSPVFSAQHEFSRAIRQGENDLLFRLPHPQTGGRLRFDPGMVRGEYLLRSLVIARENRGVSGDQF